MRFKEFTETVQAIVTIAGIVVGGAWTYLVFIKERREFPHANIEQRIAHVALSKKTNILRVSAEVTNTGASRLRSGKSVVRVQQVLPPPDCPDPGPCAVQEVEAALKAPERDSDLFTWPLLAEREHDSKHPLDVEPGEKESIEYEFAVPATIDIVRVYCYFRNDQRSTDGAEIGWSSSTYYDVRRSERK